MRKIPRAYSDCDKARVINFIDASGCPCKIKKATIMLVELMKGEYSIPMSMRIQEELNLKCGDEFNYTQKYDTFSKLSFPEVPEDIKDKIRKDRKQFEDWMKERFDFRDEAFRLFGHNSENGMYYDYSELAIITSWETWKHFNKQ